ncbi:ABC transporter ATP-binding protein [Candidatus Roizmanbacteria bacterium]|nr:ABC transporter ATP-binding protein [Candidatus Roizmanbacteria bacterium]
MDNPIVLDHISKTYHDSKTPAVIDYSLTIHKGEFFCLVGPSGCGKSTVLKMIAGLEQPTSGRLIKPEQVSMVFQSGALFPWLTVEENVALGIQMMGHYQEKIKRIVAENLSMVGLEELRKKYPRELSGGQRQRVGIARALAIQTEVLLLDEPFSALDSLTAEELYKDLLKIWQSTGKTIVMISHLLEEAVLLADRIGVMGAGTLKKIIPETLPRPRSDNDEGYTATVEMVKKELTNL